MKIEIEKETSLYDQIRACYFCNGDIVRQPCANQWYFGENGNKCPVASAIDDIVSQFKSALYGGKSLDDLQITIPYLRGLLKERFVYGGARKDDNR